MTHRIWNLLVLGLAGLVAGCVSSELPPAEQRRVNKSASLRDFAGSYLNQATDASRGKLWYNLPSGAIDIWRRDGWTRPGKGTENEPSDKILFRWRSQPDNRIMLSIEPNGDLRFRNRQRKGTEVDRRRIRAEDYRFQDGWIVLKDESKGHGPGPYYPGVAVVYGWFALALNDEGSLLVEEKSRFVGTNFVILPAVSSKHEITVYPRVD